MITRALALALALVAPSAAHAFCGTYVGGTGDSITNGASQVAYVHEDGVTTLTVANDASGDLDDFALLIPVPEVLPREAVRVIDPAVFGRLNGYSSPRLVTYECSDWEYDDDLDTDTDWDSDTQPPDPDDVDVEANYIVGEYEIVILSAAQSSGLQTWLTNNGYAVPADEDGILQGYIDGGQYFLAAKIRPDEPLADGTVLSPLQLRYASEATVLPIRIGTLDSPGQQDVIVYGLADADEGAWKIANYPEFEVPDECLFDEALHGDFEAFYAQEFDTAWRAVDGGAWTTEYAWGGGKCDPCPPETPDAADMGALGWDPEKVLYGDLFFTRLHVRYTPEQATQDLVLYKAGGGFRGQQQLRYIAYTEPMEAYFQTCRNGWATDPGTCGDDGYIEPTNPNYVAPEVPDDGGPDGEGNGNGGDTVRSGCTSLGGAGGLGGLVLLAAMLGWVRRRR